MDRQNIGMVERGGSLRLLLEPTQPVRILGHNDREYLDGNFALQD